MKGMIERKLLRIKAEKKELELKREELEYAEWAASQMAKILDVADTDEINARTGHLYRSLKILLSLHRRIRTLADYQRRGKAEFTNRR